MPVFYITWEQDNRKISPRPTPITANTKAEAKAEFVKRWPQTKIIKITKKGT